jgi:integrase
LRIEGDNIGAKDRRLPFFAEHMRLIFNPERSRQTLVAAARRLYRLPVGRACPATPATFTKSMAAAISVNADDGKGLFQIVCPLSRQRDKKLIFHSWRHGFKQALADAGTPADRIDAICGWSSGRGMQAVLWRQVRSAHPADEINKIDLGHDPLSA